MIGTGAFWNNNITEIEIPDSVRVIDDIAFWDNKLIAVEIPSSVEEIGGAVFAENNISKIVMPSDVNLSLYLQDDDDLMGEGSRFKDYYNQQDKKAGTYLLRGDDWGLQQDKIEQNNLNF